MAQYAPPLVPAPAPAAAGAARPGLTEVDWREAMSSLQKATVEFDGVPVPARVLFETLVDVANDLHFSALEPKVTEHAGFFRAGARLYRKNMSEGAQVEVTSSGPASKIIIRAFAPKEPEKEAEALVGELGMRFELAQYRKAK